MHKKRIMIFTEAGTDFGLGHITRCGALYDKAVRSGYRCELIVFSDMDDIKQLKGREGLIADWKEPGFIEGCLHKDDYCIIDSYLADDRTYRRMTDSSQKCIYIDDVARLGYPKEGVIVNPSLYFDVSRYHGRPCYNGMEYVILRKEFLHCRRSRISARVGQVLVTMGGADPRNLTPGILKLLNDRYAGIAVKVIIGNAFENTDEIKEQAGADCELIFDADARAMKEAMLQSDFAISAAGQTIYELLATQTPFLPVRIIDNQDNNIEALLRNKLIDYSLDCDTMMAHGQLGDAVRHIMRFEERKRLSSLYSQTVRFGDCGPILRLFQA